MNRQMKGVAIGTLVAGAMGFIAGIMTAPKSGKETRESIRRAKTTFMSEGEKQLKQLHSQLSDLLGEASHLATHHAAKDDSSKHHLEVLQGEVITKATRTRQKTREVLSALHDGSADDDDLDRAIGEAMKSIKSIQAYLRK